MRHEIGYLRLLWKARNTYFDNSEKNPRQPSHPPIRVTWGEQTTDEMCIGFYQFTVDKKSIKGEHTLLSDALGSD